MKNSDEFTIRSVTKVHDPEAAEKWFELYVELVKQRLFELETYDSKEGDPLHNI